MSAGHGHGPAHHDEGSKKIGFLLGREFNNRFIASSEHGYSRSLRERESLDDDLAANYGA